ncbi:hypothetical protein [Formosa sp. L2A11]|uniref:hypothetical protein n=1 Tax=Formosa sp. L2A11 TaxID=2686363 RepID=UPI00131E200D|nr:hypothetical protein [Formosa sp. L2A11]
MKTQILPNWCKKLGLALFIIFAILGSGDSMINGFVDGGNSYQPVEEQLQHIEHKLPPKSEVSVFEDYFGEKTYHYFQVFSFLGILMYMLSKEKIEDDYINTLRLESYQFTVLFGIVISILLYAFSKQITLNIDYFIQLFMYFYLITFFIKKRIY